MSQNFPPNVAELIQRQFSQFGRTGATKVMRTPELVQAIPAGPATSETKTVQFREPGTIIALYGQELAGSLAKYAATEVRVRIGGQEDLFTDGNAGVFVPLLSLFPPTTPWFPIWRRATPGVVWTVQYKNADTAATAMPSLLFAFIGDADVARNLAPRGR